MFDLIIRRARLVDERLVDIAIKEGKIAAVGEVVGEAKQEKVLDGSVWGSAGWSDSHGHGYPKSPM